MARMAERDSRVTVRNAAPVAQRGCGISEQVHFWLTLIGFHTTFLIQHLLGDEGMPRRYADYLPTDGFTATSSPPSEPSFSGYPCCRSPGTCSRAGATASRSTSTARGLRQLAGMGEQLPAADTISPSCPGSGRSGPLSSCTTRTWWNTPRGHARVVLRHSLCLRNYPEVAYRCRRKPAGWYADPRLTGGSDDEAARTNRCGQERL